MAPRKKSAAKTGAAKKTKKRTRVAAKAHSAAVSHEHSRYHTYTDHRSESYKHYSSIMKTVILFLGFVLLLAIIANIFSLNGKPPIQSGGAHSSAQDILKDAPAAKTAAAEPHHYVTPEGAEPAKFAEAPAEPEKDTVATGAVQ